MKEYIDISHESDKGSQVSHWTTRIVRITSKIIIIIGSRLYLYMLTWWPVFVLTKESPVWAAWLTAGTQSNVLRKHAKTEFHGFRHGCCILFSNVYENPEMLQWNNHLKWIKNHEEKCKTQPRFTVSQNI